MYRTAPRTSSSSTQRRNRKIISGLLVAAIAISSCSSSDTSAGDDQVCRFAQRLVDETADGDLDGVERQLDRLGDVDGIDELTDLGDLEDLAEIADEDALDDIADQVDDDLECDVDVPRIVDVAEAVPADPVAPPATPAPAPEPDPVPEPASTPAPEPVSTPAPETVPESDPAPDSEPTSAPTSEPAADGQPLAVVDVGADIPVGLDMAEIAQDPTELIAEAGVTSLPIPAGEAIGIEYDISYAVNDFSDSPEYTVSESAAFVAATDQTIEQVRDAFSNAILEATGVDYDLSESTASRDETTQSAVELTPDFGTDALRYEVTAVESTETPGLVFIEISATGSRDGALPALTTAAAANLAPAIGIGSTLGWELSSWSWSPGINQFSGDQITSGRLAWAIGTGVAADVATESAELLALIPTPEFEDIESDREFYIVDDKENWSVRYSDVFEGTELRASYSFTL